MKVEICSTYHLFVRRDKQLRETIVQAQLQNLNSGKEEH